MTKRLIETWLPIAALGEESVRERRSMTILQQRVPHQVSSRTTATRAISLGGVSCISGAVSLHLKSRKDAN